MSDQTIPFEPSDPNEPPPAPPAPNLPEKATPTRVPVVVGDRGIQLRSLAELMRFSDMLVASKMAPDSYKDNPAGVAVAIQKGMEHGLTPMAALQAVYVVNGMPSWQGKAALGLVRASGMMVPGTYRAWIEGEGDSMVAYCESQRVGERLTKNSFSVKDAIAAGLWNKDVWKKYPKRLLQWKPISHHLTDNYSDVLGNMPVAEDMIGAIREVDRETPRRSPLLGAATGPMVEDRLLASAGVTVVTDSAPAAEETSETVETEKPYAHDAYLDAKSESRYANMIALMESPEDHAQLERAYHSALTAAGSDKQKERDVEALMKKMLKKFPAPSDSTRG